MFELTINNTVYQFDFTVRFLREINPTVLRPVDGMPGVKEEMGLAYTLSDMLSGNVLALIKILDTANKGHSPRVTVQDLEAYVDDESTDIDKLCEDVMVFLRRANATKKIANLVIQSMEDSIQLNGTGESV